MYDYSRNAVETLAAAGALPDMVQVGNEISNGMLWQDGKLWRNGVPETTGFNNLAALVSAGINGTKDGAGAGNEPLIMIHHDQGANQYSGPYYFDNLLPRLQANGTDIDVIGYSYYPRFHYNDSAGSGDIADLEYNLNQTAAAYGKPVAVVETAFPWTGQQWEDQSYEFAVSESGQQQFLQAVTDAVQNVPNGLGRGVFWWFPEALPIGGLTVWENRYGLFDWNGNLLPAVDVFSTFNPGVTGDYNDDGIVRRRRLHRVAGYAGLDQRSACRRRRQRRGRRG